VDGDCMIDPAGCDLEAPVLYAKDGPDMLAIRPFDFHVLFNLRSIDHDGNSSRWLPTRLLARAISCASPSAKPIRHPLAKCAASEKAEHKHEDDRADERNHSLIQHGLTNSNRYLHRLEQIAADHRTKQANNDIANDAVTAAPHDDAGEPSGDT